jgi:hypothetical protein
VEQVAQVALRVVKANMLALLVNIHQAGLEIALQCLLDTSQARMGLTILLALQLNNQFVLLVDTKAKALGRVQHAT